MANQNIDVPRFYTDLVAYHRARGSAVGTIKSDISNTLPALSGSADELFDLRPLNQVTFDTGSNTSKHVLVNIGFTTASYKQNYIAILNHNLASSAGKIRIFTGDEDDDHTAIDGASADTADINWGSVTVSEAVNADARTAASNGKSMVIEPATDGTTIITFPEQDLRFWSIQFEGNTTNTGNAIDGTWGSTDLRVGGIMIGEYFDMPHAPDINLTRSVDYDHVNVQESLGGQRYATSTSLGRTATATSKSPFQVGNYDQTKYGGRQVYNLNFSYLDATDVLPNEYNTYQHGNDSVISDVWNLVDGPTRPFIFSIDNTSAGANAESEHIFARFDQSSLSMVQNSVSTYNISLKISEEF